MKYTISIRTKDIIQYFNDDNNKPLVFDTVNEALRFLYIMNFTFEQALNFDILYEDVDAN